MGKEGLSHCPAYFITLKVWSGKINLTDKRESLWCMVVLTDYEKEFTCRFRVSVTFQLTCIHIISSSVWVAEWPPFGK